MSTFTQGDVDELCDIAAAWEAEARLSDVRGQSRDDGGIWGINAESCRRRAAKARSLANRIAATLPPSAPEAA